jgi:hypothetical protein
MNTTQKPLTHYISWIDPQTKKTYNAGVAFYEEEYAEYRLKIDDLGNRKLYIKAIESTNDQVTYRIDEVVEVKGKKFRTLAGEGFSNKDTKGDVIFQVKPFFSSLLKLTIRKA